MQKTKEIQQSYKQIEWKYNGNVIIGKRNSIGYKYQEQKQEQGQQKQKVLGLDMDGTIIQTKSKRKFGKDENDWEWLYEVVVEKIRKMRDQNYMIVIFTNQGGIGKGLVDEKQILSKIEALGQELDVDLQVYISTGYDHCRKPMIGMWNLFLLENPQLNVDLTNSLFIGDAAGRPKDHQNSKDHSDFDLLFALNIPLHFQTPQIFFLNQKDLRLQQVMTKYL